MQQIAKERGDSENNPQDIQPDGWTYGIDFLTIVKPQLEQHGDQSDGANYHHGKRTEECALVGEKDDQAEDTTEQGRGNHRPTARQG